MKTTDYSKIISLILILGFFMTTMVSFEYFNKSLSVDKENTSKKGEDSSNYNIPLDIKQSQAFNFETIPTLSNEFFSPDTSPGNGDTVIYSFSIDIFEAYTLNISAYYDAIDNYPGYIEFVEPNGAAYLMPNGTWLIVGRDMRPPYTGGDLWLILGIGTNASNMVWKDVGKVNTTEQIAVAGNEDGKIKIAYFEEVGYNRDFVGINCFESDDWGNSWTNKTLANYTDAASGVDLEDRKSLIHGVSLGAFSNETDPYIDKFTVMWGVSIPFSNWNSSIMAREDIDGTWTSAINLTAINSIYWGNPQVIYNQTNNNGTLYFACDYVNNAGSVLMMKSAIIQLGNGIDNPLTDNWTLDIDTEKDHWSDSPQIYCAKDYKTNYFYFLDTTPDVDYEIGMKNATWDDDLRSIPIDLFDAEASSNAFNLYADNGPKCFTMFAHSHTGDDYPGILDSKSPFNVREESGWGLPNQMESIIFNGKDEQGKSREAQAYSFNLKIVDTEVDRYVYVDNKPASLSYSTLSDVISPLTSPGVNDKFTVNITSNKDGRATLNVKSKNLVTSIINITEDLGEVLYPALCGDGINNFLFFTDFDDPIFKLMFTKSDDGGLTWDEPRMIDNTMTAPYFWPKAIFTGTDLYIWTSRGAFQPILFASWDFGLSFIKYGWTANLVVEAVASDLTVWVGLENPSNPDQLYINKSSDLSFNWESFKTIDLEDAANYSLEDAAYDPISGNYSFLIINHEWQREALFVTMTHDGSKYTISDNLLPDGYIFNLNTYYSGLFDLELRKINETDNEWIITTPANNTAKVETSGADLAYSTSKDGITFSSWKNFTEITGENLDNAIFMPKQWDIIFPEDGNPSHVSGIKGAGDWSKSLRISSSSKFIFGRSEKLDLNFEAELDFYGATSDGQILADDEYNWTLQLIDRAGYKITKSGSLIIDNNAPSLVTSPNYTTPKNPYPDDEVKVTIPIFEIRPDTALLYYHTGGNWIIVVMTIDASNGAYVNFTGTIPAQAVDVSTVYWKVIVNDTSGNSLTLDNNGLLYSYGRGVYEYVKKLGALSPTLYDDWNWSYVFTSGLDHIDNVWVRADYSGSYIDTAINPTGPSANTYNIRITHDLTHITVLYKFMFKTDIEQEFTIEEKSLSRPLIQIEDSDPPPDEIDLSEDDSLEISFNIPQYIEYVSYMYIKYDYDSEDGDTEKLDYEGGVYKYEFDDFPEDATLLEYNVFVVDIYGIEIEIDEDYSVDILPELPAWEMKEEQQMTVIVVSSIIGVVIGVSFFIIMSRKTPEREILKAISKQLSKKKKIHK